MFTSLHLALSSLSAHKLRAILAMLGVFLGALALTGVQHVSKALVLQAEQEVAKLGPNLLAAIAGQVRFSRTGVRGEGAKTFTLGDAQALLNGVPGVIQGAPFIQQAKFLRRDDQKVPTTMVATWPEYTELRAFRPDIGRFFTRREVDERAKVMVLGAKVAERLFGNKQSAVGELVFLFRAGFRVVGVMEPKGRDLSGSDQDEQVFVPITTYMRRAANQDWIDGVFMRLAPDADPGQVKRTSEVILRERHRIGPGEKDDFSLLAAKEAMRVQREALQLVETLGIVSASVSFAVGGLGILSIMTLMVRMRRVEIGVRRSVGARKADIIRQFLLESGIMSATGGMAGALTSLGLVTVVYQVGGFPPVYDPVLVGASMLGSGLLGLVAGAYPAWEAARIEILDVLKS